MTQKTRAREEQRLALQVQLDRAKSPKARNQLGQFATPTALARDIVGYGLALLDPKTPIRFLDPAIGTGSFYSALLVASDNYTIDAAEGYEVDPHYATAAHNLWAEAGLALHLADFTKEPPPTADARFNLLICNPPYVRHQHLKPSQKLQLQELATAAFGTRINGLAGLYCYFLALAHYWMSNGAVAGWLMPSEFMDVNYGRAVKHYLLDKVTLLRVHRFDPTNVQFTDALVSSTIVFFQNAHPPTNHNVEFTFGGTLRVPTLAKHICTDDLRREAKWTRFPASAIRDQRQNATLKDFFQIKRGIATGGNKFFILTRRQIDTHHLPWQFFRPVLPSPRYLAGEEVQSDAAGNPQIAPELFLLDCRLSEEAIKERYYELWHYLQTGKPEVAERYLCKSRKLWYAQENRPPTAFICTYMGRSNNKNQKPFRFILNHSLATTTNVYLLLYPKPQLTRALAANPDLARKVWEVLRAIETDAVLDEGRVYGGGLYKLEPNELANVSADGIQALLTTYGERTTEQLQFLAGLSLGPPHS